MQVDVAIIGGGPAGSTLGTLLRKYDPTLRILILERDVFPRDHVGESQLPPISQILDEMGCWEKVEAANFPVKVGATYMWGKTQELWDFDFYPPNQLSDLARPGKYQGERQHLAFQVDRAIYDKILLDHARELGCDVHENTRVLKVNAEGDRVVSLTVEGIGEVYADCFVDASGHSGILRRTLGVRCDYPSSLQNVAVWDYWQNADWAEKIGVGGTRVQVMSVGYGWIWFIPLGPTRTSVGLVVPTEYLKKSGRTLPELYAEAIKQQPRIHGLMTRATSEGKLQTTKDWSFVADRHCGENWYLVGESGGFADPILAAGLTMTHAAAREAAYSILETRAGGDLNWIRSAYDDRQRRRVLSHIRFADYWYTANSQFTELQEYTAQIARDNGLDLSPQNAWAWLAQGGFINEDARAGVAGFDFPLFRQLNDFLADTGRDFLVERSNIFRLAIEGAKKEVRALYHAGRVLPLETWVRGSKIWPIQDRFALWYHLLSQHERLSDLGGPLRSHLTSNFSEAEAPRELFQLMAALEALIADGWVEASYDPAAKVIGEMRVFPTVHAHHQ